MQRSSSVHFLSWETYSSPVTRRIISTLGELTGSLSIHRYTSAQSLVFETGLKTFEASLQPTGTLKIVGESGRLVGSLRQVVIWCFCKPTICSSKNRTNRHGGISKSLLMSSMSSPDVYLHCIQQMQDFESWVIIHLASWMTHLFTEPECQLHRKLVLSATPSSTHVVGQTLMVHDPQCTTTKGKNNKKHEEYV